MAHALTHRERLGHAAAWAARAAGAVAVVLLVKAVSVTGEWERRLTAETMTWSHVSNTLEKLSTPPGRRSPLLDPRLAGIVEYVHDCTKDSDRVLAAWFFPELYYFAQRGFAGGLVVVLGGHWSEARFQSRSIDALAARQVPIVIFEGRDFPSDYSELRTYLRGRYHTDGVTNFGNPDLAPDHYTVLVLNDLRPTRIHPAWALSCFA